ncbi:MAG: hypothetical protein Pg6C_03560 [Treponemataceae bacterium]|nr:MAG: hypothetical protein Pg6C_03560 [Treponemataceae bacterium]
MVNKLFETIYNECNPIAENAYLESPLDTELKPPMLMEEIYFECNLKPLFEQVYKKAEIRSPTGVENPNRTVPPVQPAVKQIRQKTISNKEIKIESLAKPAKTA